VKFDLSKGIPERVVFGNGARKEIRAFEPTRGYVTEAWRELITEELHNLFSSTNIIRVM
jgi:hypothetical protein